MGSHAITYHRRVRHTFDVHVLNLSDHYVFGQSGGPDFKLTNQGRLFLN
jgi:hypothetical protein